MRIVAGIAGIVLVVALLVWACKEYAAWEEGCIARHGHVSSHTQTVTKFDSNGKPYSSTDTTYYCLSDDGRILDIR